MFSTADTLGMEFPFYGLATAAGIFFAFLLLRFTSEKREGTDALEYIFIAVCGGIGAFITAHIFYALAQYKKVAFIIGHTDRLFSSFRMFCLYMIDIFGGMVFYGGLIGACIGAYIYMRKAKLDVGAYADTIAPCIPLFHAFGRVGCFLVGCCYGIESSFGVVYHNAAAESANGVCRLPIQLFEAGENLIICLVLTLILYRCRNIEKGILIWIYGLIYPVVRFINEFFRGDTEERGYFGALSTSQWISIFIFVLSVFMVTKIILKRKRSDML